MTNFHAYLNSLSKIEKIFLPSVLNYVFPFVHQIHRLDLISTNEYPEKILFLKTNIEEIDKFSLLSLVENSFPDYLYSWDTRQLRGDEPTDRKPFYVYDEKDKEVMELLLRYGVILLENKEGVLMIK